MRIWLISNRVERLRTRISAVFSMPARFKGTVVEKWARYWNGLISDYSEVGLSLAKEARSKPRRTLLLASGAYAVYECVQRNPGEEGFRQSLRYWNNQLLLVPKSFQNPNSADYLRELEVAVNQNKLRCLSLGICTLIWLDRFDSEDCTYPALCEYTRVSFWQIPQRVVDVGFLGDFWRLRWQMHNFDINYL